jgi:hypothetical protein
LAFEQVPDTGCPHPDEDFHKLTALIRKRVRRLLRDCPASRDLPVPGGPPAGCLWVSGLLQPGTCCGSSRNRLLHGGPVWPPPLRRHRKK